MVGTAPFGFTSVTPCLAELSCADEAPQPCSDGTGSSDGCPCVRVLYLCRRVSQCTHVSQWRTHVCRSVCASQCMCVRGVYASQCAVYMYRSACVWWCVCVAVYACLGQERAMRPFVLRKVVWGLAHSGKTDLSHRKGGVCVSHHIFVVNVANKLWVCLAVYVCVGCVECMCQKCCVCHSVYVRRCMCVATCRDRCLSQAQCVSTKHITEEVY